MEENIENKIDNNEVDNTKERHFEELKNESVEEVKESKGGLGWKGIAIIVLAVVILGVLFIRSNDNLMSSITGAFTLEGVKGNSVDVEFYVMSQCPYGVQVEDAVKPVLDELKGHVNFKVDFIGMESNGQFNSLHGEPEVNGDKVQLCAMKYEPEKYMDMIACMNKDANGIPDNWEECAKDLDVAKIKTCYEGDEGTQLLKESFARSAEKKATGSPTIYINGEKYAGGRNTVTFKREFCKYLDIPECKDVPECSVDFDCTPDPKKDAKCVSGKCEYQEPAKFDMYVINSKECSDCDSTEIVSAVQDMFKGANVIELDISDSDGKKFADDLGLTYLPAYVLDKKVEESYIWTSVPYVQTAFEKNGEYYQILDEMTGATYFIDDKKREEYYKGLGITLGDNKPQVDFFVMSYCPYGNQAEETMYDVYKLLKNKVDFNPHYVIYSNYGKGYPADCLDKDSKYCSMHGIQELNQNIREICVLQQSGIEYWFNFVIAMNDKCTAQNADGCWSDVAEGLGLDVDKIRACEKNDGLKIAEEQLKLTTAFKARGSPAIYIDGSTFSGDRTPEGYKTAVCEVFTTKPSQCDTKLESSGSATTSTAAGCGV